MQKFAQLGIDFLREEILTKWRQQSQMEKSQRLQRITIFLVCFYWVLNMVFHLLLYFMIFHSRNIYCKYSILMLHLPLIDHAQENICYSFALYYNMTTWPFAMHKVHFWSILAGKEAVCRKLYLSSLANAVLARVPISNMLVCHGYTAIHCLSVH